MKLKFSETAFPSTAFNTYDMNSNIVYFSKVQNFKLSLELFNV